MNPYGEIARTHWAKWRPNELRQIPDPEMFFTRLGLAVETRVDALAADLAGDDPGGEDYLGKVGRLRMARFDAEAQILRELVLLPPEPGHPQAEGEQQPSSFPAPAEWLPVAMTAEHPRYHELDDDPGLLRTYPDPATPSTSPAAIPGS